VLPILPGAGGLVAEGPGFNVFALVDGVLRTPAGGVLEGITRRTVLELAAAQEIRAEAADLPVASLYRATELFLTSTAGGVMPVTTLDGQPVGDGRPGPVTTALRDAYWALHTDPRFTTEVDYPRAG
jgi:branched-chain amino acid aminotransferase